MLSPQATPAQLQDSSRPEPPPPPLHFFLCRTRSPRALTRAAGPVLGLLGLGGVAYGISESLYTVEGGHRGIMYSRISGVQDTIVEEGLHFKVPWFQRPVIYDIRAKAHRFTSPTGTKDLQMVNISLRVLYVLHRSARRGQTTGVDGVGMDGKIAMRLWLWPCARGGGGG